MLDKIIFNVAIRFDKEALPIAAYNRLQQCSEGENIFYQSTPAGKFAGVYMQIKNNRVQIKCSLHKFYYKAIFGTADNSGQFTMSNALTAVAMLFDMVGIEKERAKITYFEIGLNMPTDADPLLYIEAAHSIGRDGKEKELFNDANYRKNRQKTTEKSKTIKKVFKIYDKGWEMADRSRTKPADDVRILRIETIYRRQNTLLADFFSPANIERITRRFYRDWSSVEFYRAVVADNGIKPSQKAKAERLLLLGRDEYLQVAKIEFENGGLSEKGYRTTREFIQQWDANKHRYKAVPGRYEIEYRRKLRELFEVLKPN